MVLKLSIFSILSIAILQSTFGQECNQWGQCTNAQISQLVTAKDGLDCLKKCQNSEDCKWLTYLDKEDDYNCELFRTCEQVDNDMCNNCFSSQSSCNGEFCWVKGMCVVRFSIKYFASFK